MKRQWIFLIATLFFAVSCNMPLAAPTEASDTGLLHTIAAQTVIAHYTAEALAPDPTQTQIAPTLPPSDTPPVAPPSPTPEPTETQTATPTETATPSQIPGAILEDDFSDTTIWYAAKEDVFGFEYVDGGYQIYNRILNAAIWSVREIAYTNIIVEADAVRKNGPDDSYFGVVCHFSDEGANYIALVIGDNGEYGIARMKADAFEFLIKGVDENEIIRRGFGQTNRISGQCAADKYVLRVNGAQLAEVFDNSFTSGDVGLVAGNRLSGDGATVLFDNFALLQP